MTRNTFILILLVLLISMPGSAMDNPTPTPDPTESGSPSLESFMPYGVELESGLTPHSKVTVRDKLRELGATCHKGRLVDAKGKEIRIVMSMSSGVNRVYTPDQWKARIRAREKQRRELESKYTVIWVTRYGQ